jgi:RHS repeat-associated protein
MTSWAGEPITWTSYNYPIKITGTASFTYSYAPDRSVWLEVEAGGASTTTYRLGSPLMSIVVASSGTTDRNYIYAGNDPVAIDERTSSSNTFYYLLKDHQGSISGITNSSGAVVVDESFHPDGQRRNPTTWTDPVSQSDVTTIQGISARGYTFKETLQYLNLVNFGGRVGDVFTGRFLSADPTIPYPGDPQSYNRYSYTRNNPVTYSDPSGFEDDDCGTGGSCGLTQMQIDEGWQTVYQSSPTYTAVTNYTDTTQGGTVTSAGTQIDIYDGQPVQGNYSNLVGSYNLGSDGTWTWESSGLEESDGGDQLSFGGLIGSSGSSGWSMLGGRAGAIGSAANQRQPSGSNVGEWAYENIAIEPHVQGGVGLLGGSASSDMNLSTISGSAGLGFGYLGLDAGIDATIHLTGPELSDGFYRSYNLCAGLGFGGCVTFNFQSGNMSTELSLGANLGLSASGSYQYQKTILGPAPYSGAP